MVSPERGCISSTWIGPEGEVAVVGVEDLERPNSDQFLEFFRSFSHVSFVQNIVSDARLSAGDEVAVMVQGMGGTSNMEKFIFCKDVRGQLSDLNLKVTNSFIGEYTSSMEMAGLQLTILKLDEELKGLLEEPTEAPGWHVWS